MKDYSGYCSWCFERIVPSYTNKHIRVVRCLLKCPKCGKNLTACISPKCKNFARWDYTTVQAKKKKKGLVINIEKKIKFRNHFCLEHRGEMPDFSKANSTMNEPSEYKEIFKAKHHNLSKATRVTTTSIATAAILATGAYVAAPAIGGFVGGLTGLHGIAAVNHGLALLGGGSLASGGLGMAGGTAVISGLGAAIGSSLGAYVCNSYLKEVKDFEIIKMREGENPSIITVNGFLSQNEDDTAAWENILSNKYANNRWYHLRWESKRLRNLGNLLSLWAAKGILKRNFGKIARKAVKTAAKKIGPFFTIIDIITIANNPWHVALHKAHKTGFVLSDILRRCPNDDFILVGFSLGARVINVALNNLAEKGIENIKEAHLLGGAVDNSFGNWSNASKSTDHIYNYYCEKDRVLKYLYQAGIVHERIFKRAFFDSKPIGISPIEGFDNITNINVTSIVDGHMDHKPKACEYL